MAAVAQDVTDLVVLGNKWGKGGPECVGVCARAHAGVWVHVGERRVDLQGMVNVGVGSSRIPQFFGSVLLGED